METVTLSPFWIGAFGVVAGFIFGFNEGKRNEREVQKHYLNVEEQRRRMDDE